MTHVAIVSSYKYEDLNLLLEILKLNFKDSVTTHVFTNACEAIYARCSDVIRRDLIDSFHWVPDEGCYPGNPSRDTKRKQPLDMFRKVLSSLRDIPEGFCFLEGDCFPLSEQDFLRPFSRLSDVDIVANGFDFSKVDPESFDNEEHREVMRTTVPQSHKMPDGYIYPGGMYLTPCAADESLDVINSCYHELIDGKRNFEGMLGTVFTRAKLRRENVSDVFCYTYPKTNQLDPVSKIIHHHNVMNLRDSFRENGISEGMWVKRVLNDDAYTRHVDGVEIRRDGTPVEVCTLRIT